MMAPRFPRVVGGVVGDGCSLRATRGRPDIVLNCRFVEDGQDELNPRYISFHRGGEQFIHPHCIVVSTALFSIAAPLLDSSPSTMSKSTTKRGKTATGAIATAEASVMKKPDGDWTKSSMKKADLEALRA